MIKKYMKGSFLLLLQLEGLIADTCSRETKLKGQSREFLKPIKTESLLSVCAFAHFLCTVIQNCTTTG